MSETVEQYIARISNLVKGQDLVGVLEATPGKLVKLLEGKPADLLTKSPAAGKWSPAEIVIHLAEVEMVIGYRIRMILGSNGVAIQGFDQDAWAQRYAGQPHEPSLAMLLATRAVNLALLKSLTPEQWEQYGMHSERGKETVHQVTKMLAGHDVNHLQQLEAMLG